jgi:hypothetical protein
MLYSSGRTTGPKGGSSCPMRVFSLFSATILAYKLQGTATYCQFFDQITFVKPVNVQVKAVDIHGVATPLR